MPVHDWTRVEAGTFHAYPLQVLMVHVSVTAQGQANDATSRRDASQGVAMQKPRSCGPATTGFWWGQSYLVVREEG